MNNKILFWQNKKTLDLLRESLKKNNVCVTSTDTVLGLMANTTKSGLEKLDLIKKRREKPYIILIDSIDKLPIFVDKKIDKKLENFLNNCWPGPLTIIFKSQINTPDYLKTFHNTIAIRMPKHKYLLKLLKSFEGLFSTSANISGEEVPTTVEDINTEIKKLIEFIVVDENNINHSYPIVPSTIIDCTNEKIKIIREGIFPIKDLEKIYGEKFIK